MNNDDNQVRHLDDIIEINSRKQAEIGELPESWQAASVGSLQRFQLACSVLKALLPNIDGPSPLNTHHETAVMEEIYCYPTYYNIEYVLTVRSL